MTNEITEKLTVDTVAKQPLTADKLLAIWQQDEFWGIAGTYQCDPITGKRTKKED